MAIKYRARVSKSGPIRLIVIPKVYHSEIPAGTIVDVTIKPVENPGGDSGEGA